MLFTRFTSNKISGVVCTTLVAEAALQNQCCFSPRVIVLRNAATLGDMIERELRCAIDSAKIRDLERLGDLPPI